MPYAPTQSNKECRFFAPLNTVVSNNEQHISGEPTPGNTLLFRHLYNTYYRQLAYYAFSFAADTQQAEDLATDAFVKLWNNSSAIQSEAHAKSYLFLAVKHAAIDGIRAHQTHEKIHNLLAANSETEGMAPDLAFMESEIMREITVQVNQLPAQCATVVKHILFDGMNTEEIAREMGISTKNVLNQKALAIKKLRNVLLKKGLVDALKVFSGFFC